MKTIQHYLLPFLFLVLSLTIKAQVQKSDPRYLTSGLIHCVVTSFKGEVKSGETIIFEGKKTKTKVEAITDKKGLCDVWLPKGDIYIIKVLTVGKEQDYSTIEVPNQPGQYGGKISIQFELPLTATLDDVLFETAQSNLKPSSFASLDKLAELIKRKENLKIHVVGHTDNKGDDASNMRLSLARAKAVKDYLGRKSGSPDRITFDGKGASEPIEDNSTEAGRKLNRRTEIQARE